MAVFDPDLDLDLLSVTFSAIYPYLPLSSRDVSEMICSQESTLIPLLRQWTSSKYTLIFVVRLLILIRALQNVGF